MTASSNKLPTTFLLGIAGVAALFLAMMLITAERESFTRDDFAFLAYVQRPHWSWLEVYLPIEERWWWAYRPLGMQTFFYFGYQLFGLNAFGFFSVAIALHFATGLLAYRLMLRLSFVPVVAAAAALLSITRFPTASDIFYGSVFHYTAATFLSLLAMILFVDYARSGRASKAAGSAVCIVLGLLCNEFVIIYPFLFIFLSLYCDAEVPGASSWSPDAIRRAMWRASPYLAIAALYWVFRFHVIADVAMNRAYGQSFAPWLIRQNVGKMIFFFFGDLPTMAGFILIAAASIAVIFQTKNRALGTDTWWLRTGLLCGVWIVGLLAPFAILIVSHARFAKPLEVPISIFFAIPLQLVWLGASPKFAKALQMALVAMLLLGLPYQTLRQRYLSPVGAYPLALAQAIETHHPNIDVGSRVVLLYNAPGLASHAGGEKFKRFAFGGTAALQAYFQERQLTMRVHNLWKHPIEPGCKNCVYLQLLPKLKIVPAKRRFIRYRTPYPEEPSKPKSR